MEAAIALFGQTAAIAPTVAVAVNATAVYLFSVYFLTSSAGYFGDSAQLFITWNDETTEQTWFSDLLELDSAGNFVSHSKPIRAITGTDISYSTSYNADSLISAYDLFLVFKIQALL